MNTNLLYLAYYIGFFFLLLVKYAAKKMKLAREKYHGARNEPKGEI